jgi:hypothetical protein
MSSCDNNVYINIRDLPQVFNVTGGDFLVVENAQGTSIIDFKDIIITADQTTFGAGLSALGTAVNTLSSELKIVSNAALPSIMNVRLSLDPNTPTPTVSLTGSNASTLYVHPFKGDTVTLYDTSLSAWNAYNFNSTIGTSLMSICPIANTCYDIYLSITNDAFVITSRPWSNQNPGPNDFTAATETKFIDGISLHPLYSTQRLIGSLRTTTAGISEYSFGTTASLGSSGSHPKFFVWNMYNREPVPFSIIDNRGVDQGWTTTTLGQNASANGPFEKFGGTSDNKVSFISRESVMINLNSTHYVQGVSLAAYNYYFTYSLNLETPTVNQLLANTPGIPILEQVTNQAMTNSSSLRILPGYNFIQLISMTYTNQNVTFFTWGGNRRSFGTSGVIQDI